MHLNCKEGLAPKKGGWAPTMKASMPKTPRRRPPRCRVTHADSLLESWSLPALVWCQDIAKVKINWESYMALLNNGMQINTITPSYVKSHSLEVGLITDLIGRWVVCVGLGNTYTWPLDYIMIKVQVDGVQGYNEDQSALVVLDLLNFMARIPIILGFPTISCVINVMKERGNKHLGDTVGKCPSGPSLVSMKGCSHSGKWLSYGRVQPRWVQQSGHH